MRVRLPRLATLLAALALGACDSAPSDLRGVTDIPPITAGTTLLDGAGNPVTAVAASEPVLLKVENLAPNQRFAIVVTDPDGVEISPPGGYTIQSDEDGTIPASTIVQNLELETVNAKDAGESGGLVAKRARVGSYNVTVRRGGGGAPVASASFSVADAPRIECSDEAGAARGSFTSTETVFATLRRGAGTLPAATYDVYVLSDLNRALQDGDALGGEVRTITLDADGVATGSLGVFARGVYDVVVDVDGNGSFDGDVDLMSRRPRLNPCFTIQQARADTPVALVGQICSDAQGNHRDIFNPLVGDPDNRDMFAFITPERRPRGGDVLAVHKYVVAHQDAWAQGDPLTDVTAGFETDPVQGFCTNEAPWMVWPRQLFAAGCYDVVIDVNRNGVYDLGTDLLDNIDQRGQVSCGCRVADSDCAGRIAITAPAAGSTITATTTEIAGTVAGAPVRGYATILAGAQSNRVDLTASGGEFEGRLPLFRGENQITVTFEYADGSACSVTTTVSSDPPVADTLIRVQLTWDADVDSDLHFVRPHASGGALFDDANDCYYGNCQVGFDGADPNEIDWGLAGEADDPKLDFDCTGGCPLIENIFVNEINEPDGEYVILVDQFGGTANNVVSVFIGDTQVGQVACPTTSRNTSAAVCRVGAIAWSGGTAGTGLFTADGTVGPRSQFEGAAAKRPPPAKRPRR